MDFALTLMFTGGLIGINTFEIFRMNVANLHISYIQARNNGKMTLSKWLGNESAVVLTIYYIFYIILVVVAKPENERSYGLHEPVGPADVKVNQYAISGVVYTKQKYIDPLYFDEKYFDFRCTKIGGITGPPNLTAHPELIGEDWYAVCGTPYENHAEYVAVVWAFCAIAIFAFYNAFARSSSEIKTFSLSAHKATQSAKKGKKGKLA